jgi:IS30 family transposase
MNKYQRFSIDERELIGQCLSQGKSLLFIALCINRQVSTISREVEYYATSGTRYKAWMSKYSADYLSQKRNCRSRIATTPKLYSFIVEKLKQRWSPQQRGICKQAMKPFTLICTYSPKGNSARS